jgi:anti-sigma B factor antagonist
MIRLLCPVRPGSLWPLTEGLLMAARPTAESGGESFQIERRGDVAVITPSAEIENMPENLIEQAAQIVLAPLKEKPPGGLIVDLGRVNYFGSVFISFLLRCHLLVKKQGSELILTGVSEKARELLRVMSLDTLWAIYESRDEALAALGGSD